MKYALIIDNKVELISYKPIEGFVEVNDNVFADMIKKSDGTFDYTDEFKSAHTKVDTYADKRIKEYGSIAEQIEYITENGLDAWQSKVNSIKAKYPKE
jgi:exo-beta-1,3-glucanase (GH17 family)